MFGLFKSKGEKNADKVLELLARAIAEVRPDRFFDPLDAGLVIQPRLVLLNQLLGTDDAKRFAAVKFDDLITCVSIYEQKGLVGQLGTAVAHDTVLLALVLAAMHEKQGAARQTDVRSQAELLLGSINRQGT